MYSDIEDETIQYSRISLINFWMSVRKCWLEQLVQIEKNIRNSDQEIYS